MDNSTFSSTDIWHRVFEQVQRTVDAPMVWLAMQSVVPITTAHNYFVVGLPKDKQYLASNLKTFDNVTAIEDALREVTGRILAFRLIEGETLADWQAVQAQEAPTFEGETKPSRPEPTAVDPGGLPVGTPRADLPPEGPREVFMTWDKLGERLHAMYKVAPHNRYPHGQARFILEAVKYISDTMDVLMTSPTDDLQERALSKLLERFSSTVNLDAIFISLELFRYRAARGK